LANPAQTRRSLNRGAAVALALAIVGICTFVPAPIGAIVGHMTRSTIRRHGQLGEGVAHAAIIVGWVATILWALAFVVFRPATVASLF
jgi:hypothetical protein